MVKERRKRKEMEGKYRVAESKCVAKSWEEGKVSQRLKARER